MATKIKALTKKQLINLEKTYPRWKVSPATQKATATFSFEEHIDALIFIARVTVNAEIIQHYPVITFTHAKVKIITTTSKLKKLTTLDVALIKRIERTYNGKEE